MVEKACKSRSNKMDGEREEVTKYKKQRKKVKKLLKKKSGIRLDIGCGGNKQKGFVGLDLRDLPGVDIVWNCEEFPWPIPDDKVLVAIASHLVEHINPHGGGFIRFMDEVWRIMQPGGQFMIAAPHGSSQGYLQDPTHCNQVNEATWAYFDPIINKQPSPLFKIYMPKPWKIEHLHWSPAGNMEIALRKRIEDKSYYK